MDKQLLCYASVRGVTSCVRACVRACVSACLRACVRACVSACVRACVRACVVCVRSAGHWEACVHAQVAWWVLLLGL